MPHRPPLAESLEPRILLTGVTVIAHGLEVFSGMPGWEAGMANAIAARAGAGTSIYSLRITLNGNTPVVAGFSTLASTPATSTSNANDESILLVDWSAASNVPLFGASHYTDAGSVAALVLPYIQTAVANSGHPLGETPIHLIGHSRGASLVSALANYLGSTGLWVDQLTLLDPHPLNGIFDLSPVTDPAINLTNNILFADNYYETNVTPGGRSYTGTYNVGPLNLGGAYGSTASTQHSDVHLFYHGTIDLSPSVNDGEANLVTSWYPNNGVTRTNTGFLYSLLGGGLRPAAGLSTAFGGSAARSTLSRSGSQWPNLATIEPTATSVYAGQNINLNFRYQDYDSSATVTWILDTDQNPYNGNEAYSSAPAALGATGDVIWSAPGSFNTRTVAPGTYYLAGKITDGSHTRYSYAASPITINPGTPTGSLDVANSASVAGWAYDPLNPATPVNVSIIIDGATYANIPANQNRNDLTPVLGSANHAFNYPLPHLATGNHTIRVIALGSPSVGNGNVGSTATVSIPNTYFNESYYLSAYPDVANAVRSGAFASGWAHYQQYGQHEGRNPSAYFNESYYLAHNPDVSAAVRSGLFASGWAHFIQYGQREGRAPYSGYSESYYLAHNPDVAAAVLAGTFLSGWQHYILYGVREGRPPIGA